MEIQRFSVSFMTFLIILGFRETTTAQGQTFVYEGCSQEQYAPGSAYQTSIASLVTTLQKQASSGQGYLNATVNGVYGLYQCRGDLGNNDCANCVQNAQAQLTQACGSSKGQRIQLDGCFIRFDSYNFFGLPDNDFIYKTCDSGVDSRGDFYSHRSEVLAGLMTANFINGNGLRITSSGDGRTGYVHGLAQCEGDLSLPDCDNCIDSAVQKIKDACGNSISGQLYQSKCYVRYSQDVFYRDPYAYNGYHHHDSDEAGKTVAIIIGLLAGVALIVVFLSFLKQAFSRSGGKGKG